MVDNSFFDESREPSLIKSKIVSKYFWAWAKIIIGTIKKYNQNNQKIAYIDLFSGPGRYKDGSKSTPLLILEKAIDDPDMKERLITIFNDVDCGNTQSLQKEIDNLHGINTLKNKPIIWNQDVGDSITQQLENITKDTIPSLFFIDPWGYKGLSIRLIGSTIMNWGCECIFFFNYNRINMGINNKAVDSHINALFGEQAANYLKRQLEGKDTEEREPLIVEAVSQAIKAIGGEYVLNYRFKHPTINRTSHHLIFVSKHPQGYKIMKDIMAKESSDQKQGVASFEYNTATPKYPLLELLDQHQPINDLANMLLEDFAGQTISMENIYKQHNVGKDYILRNYKDALLQLESQGKISTNPSKLKRKKDTFANTVQVTFSPL